MRVDWSHEAALDGHRYAQPHTLEARCIRATEEDLERDSEKVAR
jgi:hypothetical protein